MLDSWRYLRGPREEGQVSHHICPGARVKVRGCVHLRPCVYRAPCAPPYTHRHTDTPSHQSTDTRHRHTLTRTHTHAVVPHMNTRVPRACQRTPGVPRHVRVCARVTLHTSPVHTQTPRRRHRHIKTDTLPPPVRNPAPSLPCPFPSPNPLPLPPAYVRLVSPLKTVAGRVLSSLSYSLSSLRGPREEGQVSHHICPGARDCTLV